MVKYPMKVEAGQSVEEMAQQLAANSGKNKVNRLYPDASAEVKQEALANIINQQRALLRTAKDRGRGIDLNNIDEVQKTADDYLQSCVIANVFPTMLGFSAAAGWSRKTIYQFIARNPNSEAARFLDNLRSSWASILAQMGLSRHASEAVSIFLLKNSGQDLTDRCELTAIPLPPERDELTPEEIAARYLDALPATDETHRKDDGE